jgi:hypothetical protein
VAEERESRSFAALPSAILGAGRMTATDPALTGWANVCRASGAGGKKTRPAGHIRFAQCKHADSFGEALETQCFEGGVLRPRYLKIMPWEPLLGGEVDWRM